MGTCQTSSRGAIDGLEGNEDELGFPYRRSAYQTRSNARKVDFTLVTGLLSVCVCVYVYTNIYICVYTYVHTTQERTSYHLRT